MSNKVYKIRDSNGLFSAGGTNNFSHYNDEHEPIYRPVTFNKVGKVWAKIGDVKSHLKLLRLIGSDWEIVEFESLAIQDPKVQNAIENKTYKASDYRGRKSITTDELIIKDIIE